MSPRTQVLVDIAAGTEEGEGPVTDALRGLAREGGAPITTPVHVTGPQSPVQAVTSSLTHVVIEADTTAGPIDVLSPNPPGGPRDGDVFTLTDVAGVINTGNNLRLTATGPGITIGGAPFFDYATGPATPQFRSFAWIFNSRVGPAGQWRILWAYTGSAGPTP